MVLAAGARLGPYEILSPLGAGGMGEVYRARDPRLGRNVALKVLPGTLALDPERLARLEREARTVARLNHPNIVTLFSIEEAAGTRFLTLELIEGRTLDDAIPPGGMPVAEVCELGIALADALAAAHAQGVIHRDLKPVNLMIARDGRLKVLDFGLAKSVSAGEVASSRAATAAPSLTEAGVVLGTAPYMSPEQVRGEVVDARSDLFAVGAILYELLSGRRAFPGESFLEVGSSILRDQPAPLRSLKPDLPSDADRIVSRCLEKAPCDRYQSALEIQNELRLLKRALERDAAAPAHTSGASDLGSIAVLPFSNMSQDPENEYFSDGLSEELLNVLAKVPSLKVTGRTSSFAFKGKHEDLREIGRKLGVSTLLEGSVRKAGNRVRITAQLIKSEDGFHLWSETYDRVLDDVFAVQDEIARAVAGALHVRLLGKPAAQAGIDAETFGLIARANHFARQHSAESLKRAAAIYHEAISRSPNEARAWCGLGKSLAMMAFYGHLDPDEAIRDARQATERALALDPDQSEAHQTMAMILASHDHSFEESRAELRKAMELAPSASGPMSVAAVYESFFGNQDEALRLARRAVTIDPLHPMAYNYLGRIEYWARHPAESREAFGKALELSPGIVLAHSTIGVLAVEAGRAEEGLAEIELEPSTGYREMALVLAYEKLGRKADSDAALARLLALEESWAAQFAMAHAARGEKDEAFRWLNRGHEVRDPGVLAARVAPAFDSLRGDPRYDPLLRKLGLIR